MTIIGTLIGTTGSGGGSGCGFPPAYALAFPSTNVPLTQGGNVRAAVAWYSFEIPVGPAIEVQINTLGSGVDTMLGLWDATGNLIDFDDDSGPGTLSLIIQTLVTGTYYVGVSQYYTNFDDGWCATGDAGTSNFNDIFFNLIVNV